jgi:hypothetical protein
MAPTIWLGRAAAVVVAGALLALAYPVAASAAVPTEVQVTFDPGAPVSGQNIEATAFIDWPTGPPPSGYVIFTSPDNGIDAVVDTTTDPVTHFTTATTSVGNFVGGSHVVNALFVPLVPGFSGSSSKTTVTVQGILGTGLVLRLPSTITVGTPVALSAGLLLPSTAYPAGGTIAFTVNGTTVGSCVPTPGALKNSAGCGVTGPAPTSPGVYSLTATFSGSPSFAAVSRTITGTATAAPATAPVVKSGAVPTAKTSTPASSVAPTPAPTPTPTPTPTTLAKTGATSPPRPVAVADQRTTAVTRSSGSLWPLVLVALLGALLGAGVLALVVVLRRRALAKSTG